MIGFAKGRAALGRAAAWSVAAVLATGLQVGCGGGNDPVEYNVTVSVTSTTDLNSVHFKLYSFFNDGDWIGHGADLECTVLVDATLESKHIGSDPPVGAILDLRLSNDNGFGVPSAIIRCKYRTAETLRDNSFAIEFLDATNEAGGPTIADVEISDVSVAD